MVSSRGQSKGCLATFVERKTRFYAAWQRGSNENSNGLLREFFPKKTDLAKVTLDKPTEALVLINKVHCMVFIHNLIIPTKSVPRDPFSL